MLIGGLTSSLMADETVRAAQVRLAELGYFDGAVDGIWGRQSSAAVQEFQMANKLRPTGELDRRTLEALGLPGTPAATPVPQAVALAELFVGGPYLKAPTEVQIATVRKAKENLKLLGFYRGKLDGLVTPELTEALRAYQRGNRFKASGRLDKTTLQALDLMTLPY